MIYNKLQYIIIFTFRLNKLQQNKEHAIMHNIVQQFINFFLNNFIIKASPCLLNIKSLSILNSRKLHDDYQAL